MWWFHLHSAVKIRPFSPVFPLAGSTAQAFCRLSLWSWKKASAIFYDTAFPKDARLDGVCGRRFHTIEKQGYGTPDFPRSAWRPPVKGASPSGASKSALFRDSEEGAFLMEASRCRIRRKVPGVPHAHPRIDARADPEAAAAGVPHALHECLLPPSLPPYGGEDGAQQEPAAGDEDNGRSGGCPGPFLCGKHQPGYGGSDADED